MLLIHNCFSYHCCCRKNLPSLSTPSFAKIHLSWIRNVNTTIIEMNFNWKWQNQQWQSFITIPISTPCWSTVSLMLGQHRKRWTKIKTTLIQSVVFVGINWEKCYNRILDIHVLCFCSLDIKANHYKSIKLIVSLLARFCSTWHYLTRWAMYYSISIFSDLKLCLAAAIHSFKPQKIICHCEIQGPRIFSISRLRCTLILTTERYYNRHHCSRD